MSKTFAYPRRWGDSTSPPPCFLKSCIRSFLLKPYKNSHNLTGVTIAVPSLHSHKKARIAERRLSVPFFCFDFFRQDSQSNLRESRRKKSIFFALLGGFKGNESDLFYLGHIFCPKRNDWQSYIAKYP